MGTVGLAQFLRAFILRVLCQDEDDTAAYVAASIVEVIYVF